ncbi:type VII secretion target [Actinophytocola sediminis]
MPTVDSFEVADAALNDHARGVTGLADELRAAFDIAGRVTLTSGTYGQSGEQVVSLLNAVAEAAEEVVRSGIDALDGAATELRASATTYTDRDTGAATSFTGVNGERA